MAEDVAGAGIIDGAHVTLTLGADGRASGTAGCNRYGGAYTLGRFGPMAATKMACAKALMSQEQRIFDMLAKVERYAVADEGALILSTPDGKDMLFRREQVAMATRA